ncbi:MAG: hypothetical protein ACK4YK_03135 [Dolichospermum sp.]|jgi:hypothetical protein
MDSFGFVIGTSGENTHKENIVKLAQLVGDCGKSLSLEAKDFDSTIDTLNSCVTKPEKLITIGDILGLPIEEETIKTRFKIFKFEGEVWGKFAKRLVKVIDVADKGIATSRIILFGQYLNRENTQGLYAGAFSVIEKPYITLSDKLDSAEIKIQCNSGNQENNEKYQALDVIIEPTCRKSDKLGTGIDGFTITNYSKNAVEIKVDVSNHLPDLLYPDEKHEYDASTFKIDQSKHGKVAKVVGGFFGASLYRVDYIPKQLTVSLKSYSPYNVAHEFTIVCGTKTKMLGLEIETKCLPPGLRAEYTNTTRHTISLNFVGSSKPPIELKGQRPENFSSGGSGTLESSSTKVNISLISNP